MLERPSFVILHKALDWLLAQAPKQILLGFVAENKKNEGWSACCAYDEKNPLAVQLDNFVRSSLKKFFEEKKIEKALPQIKTFLHKSLPQKIKSKKLEVLNRIIVDGYKMKIVFAICKSQEKSRAPTAFEEATNYIKRFWTMGRVTLADC